MHTHKTPDWYDLIFDATNSKNGKVLVGYDIIPLDLKDQFPLDKINIKPRRWGTNDHLMIGKPGGIWNNELKDKAPVQLIHDYFLNLSLNIMPQSIPAVLSLASIGLRDVVTSLDMFPVKKIFCKFDISGDSKEPITTNKHPVSGGSSDIFEISTIEVDVPTDLQFSPVLTVYVYDSIMGFLGKRLVGVANIPLEKYCKKVM